MRPIANLRHSGADALYPRPPQCWLGHPRRNIHPPPTPAVCVTLCMHMHAHTCTHAQKAAQVPFVISVRKFALAWCWVSICHRQILCGQRAFAESDLALAFQFFSSSLPLTSSSPPPHHLQTVLTFRCRNRGGLCCAVARQPGGSVSPFFQMPSDLRSPLRGCQ